jgi:hypothetical protein
MPGMDSFWHLHPQRMPDGLFVEDLPEIPSGHYQMFADVVLSNGFPMTLTGQIDVPDLPARAPSGDDSGTLANPIAPDSANTLNGTDPPVTTARAEEGSAAGTPGQPAAMLAGGGRMIWERDAGPLHANVPILLRFRIEDDQGQPAADIQSYMGMAAHAAIVKSDASVFVHLHPSGSVSMAAFEIAQASLPGGIQTGGMAGMPGMAMPAAKAATFGPEVSFPYGFPKPGLYRIFVQIKRAGQIQTGIFEATVE